MKGYSTLMLAVVLFVVTACAPSALKPTPPVSSTVAAAQSPVAAASMPTNVNALTAGPALAPNPITVKFKAEANLAASTFITNAGGTLTANGADGARFLLTIPKDALISRQKITLAPVTAVDGLPFSGGLVAAASIEPDGLALSQPATLTVELSKALASDGFQEIGFAAQGNGTEFHLAPSQSQGATITFQITHFSLHGAAKATLSEITNVTNKHAPTRSSDQHDQLRAGDKNFSAMSKLLDEKWFLDLKPELENAAAEAATLDQATARFQDWKFHVEEDGLAKELEGDVQLGAGLIAKGVLNAIKQASRDCVEHGDASRVDRLVFLLWWYPVPLKWAHMTGAPQSQLQDEFKKCATFELDFSAGMTNEVSSPAWTEKISYDNRSKVMVQFSTVKNAFRAQAPIRYSASIPEIAIKIPGTDCKYKDAPTASGDLKVSSPIMDVQWDDPDPGYPDLKVFPDIQLTVDPDPVEEQFPPAFCTQFNVSWTENYEFGARFSVAFDALHQKERMEEGFLITDWQRGGGGAYARKHYPPHAVDCLGNYAKCNENTTLELIHQPQK